MCLISRESDTCRTSKCPKLKNLWRHIFLSLSYFSLKMSTQVFSIIIIFLEPIFQKLSILRRHLFFFFSKIVRQVSDSREMGLICICYSLKIVGTTRLLGRSERRSWQRHVCLVWWDPPLCRLETTTASIRNLC